MFKYSLLIQKIYSEDFGIMNTYGILILDENDNEFYKIPDVSCNKEHVQKIIDECNKYQIHPVYIYSIIENVYDEEVIGLIEQMSIIQSENLKKSMMKIITCS